MNPGGVDLRCLVIRFSPDGHLGTICGGGVGLAGTKNDHAVIPVGTACQGAVDLGLAVDLDSPGGTDVSVDRDRTGRRQRHRQLYEHLDANFGNCYLFNFWHMEGHIS